MERMNLKEIRQKFNLTLKEAAAVTGVPLRTFSRYENDENYGNILKRNAMIYKIVEHYEITEQKGLLTIDAIKAIVGKILSKYKTEVSFCYLFGSYAKGYATEKSDVDLLVETSVSGLQYFGLVEELREALHKKVDLIRLNDLSENFDLIKEIMKDGIKIYDQKWFNDIYNLNHNDLSFVDIAYALNRLSKKWQSERK